MKQGSMPSHDSSLYPPLNAPISLYAPFEKLSKAKPFMYKYLFEKNVASLVFYAANGHVALLCV